MPNHVTTLITCDSFDDLKTVTGALAGEGDQLIDFKRVIPKPEGFKDTEAHCGLVDKARQLVGIGAEHGNGPAFMSALSLSNFNRSVAEPLKSIEDIDAVADMARNYMISGYMYWYDWNIEHWGTKWNAYSVDIDASRIKMETAWSHPELILRALSKQLPDVILHVRYADEDTGSNCGSYTLRGGYVINQDIAPSWREMKPTEKYKWIEFALSINDPGSTPESHGYDTNGEYSEELYEKHNPEDFA